MFISNFMSINEDILCNTVIFLIQFCNIVIELRYFLQIGTLTQNDC